MADIKIGDLVVWEAGKQTHAGVVKKITDDGTATISRKTDAGQVEIKIRSERLEAITSTITPAGK